MKYYGIIYFSPNPMWFTNGYPYPFEPSRQDKPYLFTDEASANEMMVALADKYGVNVESFKVKEYEV